MQGCTRRNVLKSDPARPAIAAPAAGIACGAGAALFWAAGFVAGRHGLAVIRGDALAPVGAHGLIGDLSFGTAGLLFASFATLLRLWHIAPTRAVAATSVVSLVDIAIHWFAFGFERMIALGLAENLLQ